MFSPAVSLVLVQQVLWMLKRSSPCWPSPCNQLTVTVTKRVSTACVTLHARCAGLVAVGELAFDVACERRMADCEGNAAAMAASHSSSKAVDAVVAGELQSHRYCSQQGTCDRSSCAASDCAAISTRPACTVAADYAHSGVGLVDQTREVGTHRSLSCRVNKQYICHLAM